MKITDPYTGVVVHESETYAEPSSKCRDCGLELCGSYSAKDDRHTRCPDAPRPTEQQKGALSEDESRFAMFRYPEQWTGDELTMATQRLFGITGTT
jgi:hypothetical protein